jgi:hypothetical protein
MASGLIGFEMMKTTGVLHTALAGCEKRKSFNNALSHSHGQCLKPRSSFFGVFKYLTDKCFGYYVSSLEKKALLCWEMYFRGNPQSYVNI